MSGRRDARRGAEYLLEVLDTREIAANVLASAALAGARAETASGEDLSRADSAQVNHGSQILLVRERGGANALPLQRPRHVSIQECRCHLGRVAGNDAEVQAVEPARFRLVPRSVLDDDVIVNAIAPRLAVCPVGDLVHANRARRRAIHVEGILGQAPAPVGPGNRVARALDLRERGQQVGRDDGGRVLAEDRLVLAPRLGGRLEEHAAHGKEQLGRLARDLHQPIGGKP